MNKYLREITETDTHVYFWGGQLSNFWQVNFSYKGYTVASSEQAFMLEKALTFDPLMINPILSAKTPKLAKQLGRQIKNYNDEIWANKRYETMIEILKLKFSNPLLKRILLSTEDKILVEGSPFDKIWGVGIKYNDPKILDESNWNGSNLLGEALMEVRKYLKENG